MNLHQPHPKCKCGKPLYKAFEKGTKVSPADPYKFCRNRACALSGPKGQKTEKTKKVSSAELAPASEAEQKPKEKPAQEQQPAVPTKKRRLARPASERPPQEPEAVRQARERVRAVLPALQNGKSKNYLGLVLAILVQESGSYAAANTLIDEFQLREKFGFEKFEKAAE